MCRTDCTCTCVYVISVGDYNIHELMPFGKQCIHCISASKSFQFPVDYIKFVNQSQKVVVIPYIFLSCLPEGIPLVYILRV